MDILTRLPPSLVLSIVIASMYAALYNLWRNGSPRDLLFCLVAAWAGFALGQAGGWLIGLEWGMIGSIYMIEGTTFAWMLLFLMNWLRMPPRREPSKG
jgi:hypothetical protein